MATCNAYPKFEANQVLTAEQLNRVVAYLKGQDLLPRRKFGAPKPDTTRNRTCSGH